MRQQWRDEFIASMARKNVSVGIAQRLLRYAATAQRLSEAACNGDWPADNGERPTKECPECQGGWVASSFRRGVCPDCAHERVVHQFVAAELPGWGVRLHGDPRGCVLKVIPPDVTPRNDCDDAGAIGVPS